MCVVRTGNHGVTSSGDLYCIVACCHPLKLCAHAARAPIAIESTRRGCKRYPGLGG